MICIAVRSSENINNFAVVADICIMANVIHCLHIIIRFAATRLTDKFPLVGLVLILVIVFL